MSRIAGFVDSVTLNIITTEHAKRSRAVHRSISNLIAHKARYAWVWRADAAGTLQGWHIEDGVLYPDAEFSRNVWTRVQHYVSTCGLCEKSLAEAHAKQREGHR